jgi:hypothetical protein
MSHRLQNSLSLRRGRAGYADSRRSKFVFQARSRTPALDGCTRTWPYSTRPPRMLHERDKRHEAASPVRYDGAERVHRVPTPAVQTVTEAVATFSRENSANPLESLFAKESVADPLLRRFLLEANPEHAGCPWCARCVRTAPALVCMWTAPAHVCGRRLHMWCGLWRWPRWPRWPSGITAPRWKEAVAGGWVGTTNAVRLGQWLWLARGLGVRKGSAAQPARSSPWRGEPLLRTGGACASRGFGGSIG